MVDTRATGPARTDGIRPESSRERDRPPPLPPTGGSGAAPPRSRQRIPTLHQLAALMVDGILTLPRNYRRGMYLDILV
jgi:hypothetical protein